jgi:hypothetical protein
VEVDRRAPRGYFRAMAASNEEQVKTPTGPIGNFQQARRLVREHVVSSPYGWLLPLVLAPGCFFLLAYFPEIDIAPLVLIVVPVIVGIVATLFETLYVGLWQGTLPWTRAGPAILFAFVWTVTLSVLGIGILAPITFHLYDAGHLGDISGIRDDPHGAATLYTSWQFAIAYFWQLCDVIPLLKVTDTVDWDRPLQHGTRMGLLLLAYAALVLVPLAASLRGIWAGRQETG